MSRDFAAGSQAGSGNAGDFGWGCQRLSVYAADVAPGHRRPLSPLVSRAA